LAELQKSIKPAAVKSLQANGYINFVTDTMQKYSVYVGSRTALEDRFAANIDSIYKNLDKT
jgi:hypothetical protein